MTSLTAARCAACGIARPLSDMLAVWEIVDEPAPDVAYVCRPSIGQRDCLARASGPASVDAIALADSDADSWDAWTAAQS